MAMFKHLVAPTDFSEPGQRAIDLAIDLATSFEAMLTLVHVYEIPVLAYTELLPLDLLKSVEEAAREQMNKVVASVQQRVPAASGMVRSGVPWQEILKAVEEAHGDLIVLGTHGRRGVSHVLLGSVAEKIVRLSSVPVLTVRTAPRRPGT